MNMATQLDWKKIYHWFDEERIIMFIDTMGEFDEHSVRQACHNEHVTLLKFSAFDDCITYLNLLLGGADKPFFKNLGIVISNVDTLCSKSWLDLLNSEQVTSGQRPITDEDKQKERVMQSKLRKILRGVLAQYEQHGAAYEAANLIQKVEVTNDAG